jgi:hypothetical protein
LNGSFHQLDLARVPTAFDLLTPRISCATLLRLAIRIVASLPASSSAEANAKRHDISINIIKATTPEGGALPPAMDAKCYYEYR